LIPKSQAALSRYGHQLVIGNDLHKRKYEVVFVERKSTPGSPASYFTPIKGQGDTRINGAQTPPILANGSKALEDYSETWLRLKDFDGAKGGSNGDIEIEELIVHELVGRHQAWIDAGR
jgi:phosphopantothenate-cysteine ligase